LQQTTRQLNSLQQNHDELNRLYEQEQEARDLLAKSQRELKKDYDFVRDQHEIELSAKLDMQKALSKSNTEVIIKSDKKEISYFSLWPMVNLSIFFNARLTSSYFNLRMLSSQVRAPDSINCKLSVMPILA
jgi:hypothetical protein